jgi:hypothetical protein
MELWDLINVVLAAIGGALIGWDHGRHHPISAAYDRVALELGEMVIENERLRSAASNA